MGSITRTETERPDSARVDAFPTEIGPDFRRARSVPLYAPPVGSNFRPDRSVQGDAPRIGPDFRRARSVPGDAPPREVKNDVRCVQSHAGQPGRRRRPGSSGNLGRHAAGPGAVETGRKPVTVNPG